MEVRNNVETLPPVGTVEQPTVAKPRIDFKKAAEQQNLAVKTQTVYNNGAKEFDELSKTLKELGGSHEFTAQKFEELDIDPDVTTVSAALKAIDEYNAEGKNKVSDIARKNVRLGSLIKEEGKVKETVERLWESADEPKAEAKRSPSCILKLLTTKPRLKKNIQSLTSILLLGLYWVIF